MASNHLICWPNLAGSPAVLSGGSWVSTLPLTNLTDYSLSKVARTTDLNESSTKFTLILDEPSYIRVIALLKHNFSLSAKMSVTIYEDEAGTLPLYTTGMADVWPSIYSTEELEWEDDNFWTGTLSTKDIESFPKLWLKVFSERQYVKRIDFEPVDKLNPDAYLEFGGLFIAMDWQPEHNMEYGATLGWNDPSEITEAWDGTEHFRERKKYRSVSGTLSFMGEEEAVNKALKMTADRGITKDVFFVWDPDDTVFLVQRSFLGRLSTLSPNNSYNWQVNSMPIQIKERV